MIAPPDDDCPGEPASDGEMPDDEDVVAPFEGTARARARDRKRKQKTPAKAQRPLKPWEQALVAELIVDKKVDRTTGEESYVIRPTVANASTILQRHPDWKGVIALNIFHHRIEATRVPPWHPLDAPKDPRPGPWTDANSVRTSSWFERTRIANMPPIKVSADRVKDAVLVAAEANTFHPVRDYLNGLKWDGIPRLDSLSANYLGGEITPYAKAAGASFMIGAVARVMQPGCKLDTAVILEGGQGQRKSTFLEVLASPWFADSKLPIGEKDGYQNLPGVWIWELGELSALSKADVETIKAYMSSRKDRFRPSYGQYVTDVERQVVFAGTTNLGEYLHDATGARRFVPLRTGAIDIEATRRDKDQLWAEALHRYRHGERWWLDDALAQSEQAMRYVEDEWQRKISDYLAGKSSTTIAQILGDLIFAEHDGWGGLKNSMGKWGQREQNRVAHILTNLGWKRRQLRNGTKREWHYVPPNVTTSEDVPSPEGEVVT